MATAATVSGIREDLQARLDTIASLTGRTYAYIPDSVNPPLAYVTWPETLEYDAVFQRGLDTYEFLVRVLVGRVDAQSSAEALDAYVSAAGPDSIKVALENGFAPLPTTGNPCRVARMRNYGGFAIGSQGGDVTLLGCEFVVELMG